MDTKEIKITPPEGFEIDKENSTFDCIKFKPIEKKRWRDNENIILTGYYVSSNSFIREVSPYNEFFNTKINFNVFATEKQAKSALAMARISQIMANDERFGGVVTDKQWLINSIKYTLERTGKNILKGICSSTYIFLAFHTKEQRDLFLEENEDLVRDYLML